MTEKKINISPFIVCGILILGLILTAAMPAIDLELSKALTSTPLVGFAEFLEIWGEPPTLLVNAFICAMAAVFCLREKKTLFYVLGPLAAVAGGVCCFMTFTRTVEYHSEPLAEKLWIKLIAVAFALLFMAVSAYFSRKFDQELLRKMSRVMLFVIIGYMVSLILVNVTKGMWGRMRFREYVVSEDPVFSPWYLPQGKAISDAFKSFPSGHSSNAMMLLPATFMPDAAGNKRLGRIFRTVFVLWVVLVMFTRIVCGAHYLSDVCGGALCGYLTCLLVSAIIFRKKAKKT